MTLYKHKQSQPLKWLVAIIVFMLAMTITFDSVYGGDNYTDGTTHPNSDIGNDGSRDSDSTPMPVPEPTTLLLIAGGLSAMYLARRRGAKKK